MRSMVKPLRSALRMRVMSAGSIPVIEAAFRFERENPDDFRCQCRAGIFQFRIRKANVPERIVTAAYDFDLSFFHPLYSFNHCILFFMTSISCLGIEMPLLDFF